MRRMSTPTAPLRRRAATDKPTSWLTDRPILWLQAGCSTRSAMPGTDFRAIDSGAQRSSRLSTSRSAPRTASAQVLVRRMPDDALTTAQQLFAVLRDFDAQGVRLIWIETPPADMAWDGVRDRWDGRRLVEGLGVFGDVDGFGHVPNIRFDLAASCLLQGVNTLSGVVCTCIKPRAVCPARNKQSFNAILCREF